MTAIIATPNSFTHRGTYLDIMKKFPGKTIESLQTMSTFDPDKEFDWIVYEDD